MTVMAVASDDRTYVLSFGGAEVGPGGSLVDGVYDLNVPSVAGAARSFHRLFSDGDGDGDSDNADLFQLRGTYGKNATEHPTVFKSYFDYEGDGDVDNADLLQVRSRRAVEFKGY